VLPLWAALPAMTCGGSVKAILFTFRGLFSRIQVFYIGLFSGWLWLVMAMRKLLCELCDCGTEREIEIEKYAIVSHEEGGSVACCSVL